MTTPSSSPPVLFGVLNVTPDSFSDGGEHLDPAVAVERGLRLVADGADLVDVGGESTRPGAQPVDPEEEARRVLPVVRGLVAAGVPVSIDTRRAAVAAAAAEAGAAAVNDVDGGAGDPAMLGVVAGLRGDYVVMHSRGPSGAEGGYADVVTDVIADLRRRVEAAVAAGVAEERLIVDPGIGFAKTAEESWALLAQVDRLGAAFPGLRLLVGASRKRFLSAFAPDGAPAVARDPATAALSALLTGRVWGLRVHDVAGTRIATSVALRMRGAA